jgi:enoyl-CoA hydratase
VTVDDGVALIEVPHPEYDLMYWSLLCGVQNTRFLALKGDAISGREAERTGLVSMALPDGEVTWRFCVGLVHSKQPAARAA